MRNPDPCDACFAKGTDHCFGCEHSFSALGCGVFIACAAIVIILGYGLITHLLGVGTWNW